MQYSSVAVTITHPVLVTDDEHFLGRNAVVVLVAHGFAQVRLGVGAEDEVHELARLRQVGLNRGRIHGATQTALLVLHNRSHVTATVTVKTSVTVTATVTASVSDSH